MKKMSPEELADHSGISLKVLDEIIDFAITDNIEKIVLFGSRARGDYEPKSDIDLYIFGKVPVGFYSNIDEETSTLLFFDIVFDEKCSDSVFKMEIQRDGIILYEKER